MVPARAADTDGVTSGASAPALTATPNWSPLFPNVASANAAAEPVANAKKGWILGRSDGTITDLDAIAAGTWTASVVITPGSVAAQAFAVGVRAYQVSADLATTTLITLTTPSGGSAGANGWEYAANQTASLGAALTFTLTMASVGAVTLSTTKNLYIGLVLKFAADDTLTQPYVLTSFTLTVPALTYPTAPATTGTASPAMARKITAARSAPATATGTAANRKALTVAGPKSATATGTGSIIRSVGVTKSATATGTAANRKALAIGPKSVTATGTGSLARTISAARAVAATATGTMGFARALILARTHAASVAGTSAARLDIPQSALNRLVTVAPDWPLNAPTKAITGVTRDAAGAVLVSATVKLVRQVDGYTVQTLTSNATTGAYSFTRGTDDVYTYRVVATKAGSPEVHGVTDVLVPA